MSSQIVLKEIEDKMKKSLEVVNQYFAQVRTGRANIGMVEHMRVDYYGAMTPLKQMANITIPEPRLILIHPWDVGAIKMIEKAVLDSDLGIAPVVDGKMIRLPVPPLSRERREDLAKIVKKQAEEGHVVLRSLRREANEKIKALEKEKKIDEDDSFKSQAEIQKLTDRYVQLIDQAQQAKEKELTQG